MALREGMSRLGIVASAAYVIGSLALSVYVTNDAWNNRQSALHYQIWNTRASDGQLFLVPAKDKTEAQSTAEFYAEKHPVDYLNISKLSDDELKAAALVAEGKVPPPPPIRIPPEVRIPVEQYDHPPSLQSVWEGGAEVLFTAAIIYAVIANLLKLVGWVASGFLAKREEPSTIN